MESVAILLVDDEASVLQFFHNALTDAGFEVEMMLFAEALSNVRLSGRENLQCTFHGETPFAASFRGDAG
ncbi:hypothetical protein [Rhizobium leguminosarum]|uniref:hypothetical protein n=1 Tax=Rhizobium leguminosarum TaxID=384 RepID=UPI0014429FFB|nr:hypothetical protein [Rhizobium leguminosarum]MBY5868486.1 hypothetical protein [Rhizobium leguminosarum]NKM07737.1 hypothetical protein [Rhizobium leguminosarum bv. viciae]